MNDDAYIAEDGLPHCKKCGDRLVTQDVVEMFGKRMPVVCRCRAEELKRQHEQEMLENRMQMIDKLRKASLIGERYKDVRFDTTDIRDEQFSKIASRCHKYCEIAADALKNGYGMYLYGNSGVGKTHLTACMCNELISKYKQCLFTNFFEISKLIRSTFSKNTGEDMIARICDVDFLFIDDIGTERLKKGNEDSWLQEQVYDIINRRYNNKKPTIFTSNYSINELITDRGMMEKTVDRISEMSTAIIKLTGESYRKHNAPKNAPF